MKEEGKETRKKAGRKGGREGASWTSSSYTLSFILPESLILGSGKLWTPSLTHKISRSGKNVNLLPAEGTLSLIRDFDVFLRQITICTITRTENYSPGFDLGTEQGWWSSGYLHSLSPRCPAEYSFMGILRFPSHRWRSSSTPAVSVDSQGATPDVSTWAHHFCSSEALWSPSQPLNNDIITCAKPFPMTLVPCRGQPKDRGPCWTSEKLEFNLFDLSFSPSVAETAPTLSEIKPPRDTFFTLRSAGYW